MARSACTVFLSLGLAAMASVAVRPASAQQKVDDFRTKMEKWVETQQILSEEKSDWEVEKETLQATKDLLQQEKKALQARSKEVEEFNTEADDERRDLLLERGELQRANRALEDELRALETRVLTLAAHFPQPLQKKLEPLLSQIPEPEAETRAPLGQRLVNVLGVLSQADKFNGTATLEGETRAVGGDQKVQIRTLYWGLSQAVYVAAQGRTAGVARPAADGAEGWSFDAEPDLADEASALIDIYEGNIDAIRFVELPVDVR